MADENKPDEQGGENQQTEPQKDVVSYAKYRREVDELTKERDGLKGELANRDQQIADITAKAGNAEDLQKALDDANAANAQYKQDAEAREAGMRRDFAIEAALRDMGARNVVAARALIDNDAAEKAKVGEDGKVSGIDFDAIKTANPYLFADQQRFDTGGTQTGGVGGSNALSDFKAQFGLDDNSGKE